MVRTQIQLTKAQAEALRRMSRARGCSQAELVRQGVDFIIAQDPAASSRDRRERAAAISGRFRSGRRDLSRRHDRHLAEALAE
jgi:hypothetical protein